MYILTGGAGFIGSNLLKDLNDRGITDILVVDSLGSTEKWKNLVGKRFSDYCDKSDFFSRLSNSRGLPDAVKGIFHLGACSSTMEKDASYVMQNNFLYSKTLCEFAQQQQCRFIYASSAATYGDGAQGFSDESSQFAALKPLNIYAYSKLLFDCWVLERGLEDSVVGLRFFNVYGPNEYHKEMMRSVVLKSFEQIVESGEVSLFRSYRPEFADGEQKRDFIYVEDCTEAICQILEAPHVSGIFNLGSGKARSWLDLARAVFAAMNLEPQIKFIDMPESLQAKYQYFTQASMKRFQTALPEWSPKSLEQGVGEYVREFLTKDKEYR